MDFETSCWSAGSLANTAPTFYNPVQRRPKIDYFDSASITPIVSHISSNGYYGYIPTTHVPSTLVDLHSTNSPQKEQQQQQQHQLNGNSMCYNDMVTMEMPNSEQSKHQGRSMIENRKRAVQSIADDFAAEHDVKRRRSHLSVIDYVEDMQLGYDDVKDVTYNASNIASKQLSIEQFYVCIKENVIPIDQVKLGFDWNRMHQRDTMTNPMPSLDLDNAIQRTDDDFDDGHDDNGKSTAKNEHAIDDMENLYWHTHGSLLWQH